MVGAELNADDGCSEHSLRPFEAICLVIPKSSSLPKRALPKDRSAYFLRGRGILVGPGQMLNQARSRSLDFPPRTDSKRASSTCGTRLPTCERSLQPCGRSLRGCGRCLQVCGTSLTGCGRCLQSCGRHLQTCGTSLQVCGTSLQGCGRCLQILGSGQTIVRRQLNRFLLTRREL